MEVVTITTRVYQYGAVPTSPFPQEGIESLFQANVLWNKLVGEHNAARERLEAARVTADAEYALVAESIRLADQAVEDAYKEKREARNKASTKDASHPLISAANELIKDRKAQRAELWSRAKLARKRADILIDRAALNATFKAHCNEAARVENTAGLGSVSAGAIREYFETARSEALKKGDRLQFHRFDGTGFLLFRFREADSKTDGVPFDWLMGREGDERPFVILGRIEGKKPRLQLRVKVAGGRKVSSKVYANFDLILHRPIPAGAQVQNAKLLRRRTGDRFHYHVDFTLRLPQRQTPTLNPAALGVDIGFRELENGAIRVAAVGGSNQQDGAAEVVVEARLVDRLAYVDTIKGRLDQTSAVLGVELKPLMRPFADDETHRFRKLARSVAHLPAFTTLSFEKAYKLARTALRDPTLFNEEVNALLAAWLKSNGRAYRELHNLRSKVLSSRKHLYRNVAAGMVKAKRPIGVESLDLRAFAETRDRDNKLANKARANRFLASPSELIAAIRNAAQREGLPFVAVGAAYTSKTCSACGAINKELKADQAWACQACGTIHDRDANAAVNIARRALEKIGLPLEHGRARV